MTAPINVVFDGPPGPIAGRFVEVETDDGAGIRVGEWIERPNGWWALRITALPQTSVGRGAGDAPRPTEHHVTEAHRDITSNLLADHQIRFDLEDAAREQLGDLIAEAIADAEDRVRFGSAYCPDCGVHVDNGPHADDCPHSRTYSETETL